MPAASARIWQQAMTALRAWDTAGTGSAAIKNAYFNNTIMWAWR
jgi:hypothetical protein